MILLVLGLVLFLGAHSVRIFADDWRGRMRARFGEGGWKLVFSLVSLAGLVLIVWGYGLARQAPLQLWTPPAAMRHVAALLTLVSFVLLAATYVPRNGIKARLHHPMLLAVKVWALAHLLANGSLADVLLFGAFLLWAVLCFRTARRRDRMSGAGHAVGGAAGTVGAVAIGVAAWLLFAFWAHEALIGVAPFA